MSDSMNAYVCMFDFSYRFPIHSFMWEIAKKRELRDGDTK